MTGIEQAQVVGQLGSCGAVIRHNTPLKYRMATVVTLSSVGPSVLQGLFREERICDGERVIYEAWETIPEVAIDENGVEL